ncbi:MAG TPA: efflux RND transporter periplasmic adaptor subunit [Stellaceae bacterium]|nr:efflux RND transporter periplasmic adaptor subunit [Stellaceae bacterium]
MPRRPLAIVGGIGALVLAAGIGGWVWSGHRTVRDPPADPATPVNVGKATRQNVPVRIEALGTVQPIETVSVESRVNGQIEKVFFTQGQEVKAGAPLFLIDPRPYQAALDQAQGQLAHDQAVLQEARTDLARYQRLARQNAIAKQQAEDQAYVVQQDQGTVTLDQANLETARLNLAYCRIAAPAAGLTGALLVDPGNYVQATGGTALVTITQIKPIDVSFTVPESDLDEIRANQAKQPLDVEALSQAGRPLATGKLSLIDNQANTATGTVMLEGTFDNGNEALWPGQFVSIRLVVATRANAVTVPAQAVMAGPNGSYVYVIGPDDTVARVPVTVAARQDGIAVIAKGLDGTEQVVTDGQYRLADKVKVTIVAPGAAPGQGAGGTPSPSS